jgi:hypothetical protein
MQNCLAIALADILCNSSNEGETNTCLVIPAQGVATQKNAPLLPH